MKKTSSKLFPEHEKIVHTGAISLCSSSWTSVLRAGTNFLSTSSCCWKKTFDPYTSLLIWLVGWRHQQLQQNIGHELKVICKGNDFIIRPREACWWGEYERWQSCMLTRTPNTCWYAVKTLGLSTKIFVYTEIKISVWRQLKHYLDEQKTRSHGEKSQFYLHGKRLFTLNHCQWGLGYAHYSQMLNWFVFPLYHKKNISKNIFKSFY